MFCLTRILLLWNDSLTTPMLGPATSLKILDAGTVHSLPASLRSTQYMTLPRPLMSPAHSFRLTALTVQVHDAAARFHVSFDRRTLVFFWLLAPTISTHRPN